MTCHSTESSSESSCCAVSSTTDSSDPGTTDAVARAGDAHDGSVNEPTPDAAVDRFLREGHCAAVDVHHRALWQALRGATEGGKRFRPRLLMSAYRALAPADRATTLASDAVAADAVAAEVAAAIELLHTAFVLHDDVIDSDVLRRGRPNVSGAFAAAARSGRATPDHALRYGQAAGIVSGDLALAGAVKAIALCGAPAGTTARLLDLMDRAIRLTSAGELADVRLSLPGERGSVADAITVAEHKTAVYSFELPLQAGAMLAGASEELVGEIGQLGRLLGIAFQLLDDLDGVFGDPAVTGKSVLTDLREGTRTVLIAHARTTAWWRQMSELVGDPRLDDDGARRVRDMLESSGSRAFAEHLATSYLRAAQRLGSDLGLASGPLQWALGAEARPDHSRAA